MMKYLFYVVVIANLCFFLWEVQQGGLSRFSPLPATEKGEKQILLLSELKEHTSPETPNNKKEVATAKSEGSVLTGTEKLGERLEDDFSPTKLFRNEESKETDDRPLAEIGKNFAEEPFMAMEEGSNDPLAAIESMLGMEFEADNIVQTNAEDMFPAGEQTSIAPETDMPAMESETIPQPVASLQQTQETTEQLFLIEGKESAPMPDADVKITEMTADHPSDNVEKPDTVTSLLVVENEVVTPITPKIEATTEEGAVEESNLSVSEENVEQAGQLVAVSEEEKSIEQKIDETAKEAAAVEPNVSVPEIPPETVERDNVFDEADKPATVASNCREIGPFDDNRSMQNWLNGRNIDRNNAETVNREVPISTSWIVVYPAGETMEESKQNLDMLKKKGVKDLWLFRKGPMYGMISLGLFSKQSRAEKLRQQLVDKDIAAEIKERHKTEPRIFARIKQEIEIEQTEGLEVFDCVEHTPETF